MEEFKKMVSGVEYNPNSDYLISLRDNAKKILHEFNHELDSERRGIILKDLFGKMGAGCCITPIFYCDYGCNIEIGDNVYFNTNCVILDCAKVTIGESTFIGPNVQIYTPVHPIDYKKRNTGIESAKPINIGENCWIGGNACILPGVTIGSGCVIGAGSLVTNDIPKNTLAFGSPARVVRTIRQ